MGGARTMGIDLVQVNLFDLVSPLAKAIDMMSPAVADHHMRVTYLAFRLAQELRLPSEEVRDLVIAGALHDIGGFSLNERVDILQFEDIRPNRHAIAGYLLLKDFEPFAKAAEMVRYHHKPWDHGEGAQDNGNPVPRGSHILHLADRVAVLLNNSKGVLGQVDGVRDIIEKRKGSVFVPEFAEALARLTTRDYIWLEAVSGATETVLRREIAMQRSELDLDDLIGLSRLLCRIIDFKSEFTATHSSGVVAAAVTLSEHVGFSAHERQLIRIAAYLHDLGKLAIPSEILEKKDRLTEEEWNIMRTHVFYTYQILDPIDILKTVASWGALHQERMNGTGYPFGRDADDLPLGARIMAVADVFVALTEDRPYRKGMTEEAVREIFAEMRDKNELDAHLVDLALEHYDEINERRAEAQSDAMQEYEAFKARLAGG